MRSERSLVQTCGRAARNAGGKVILYGDKITKSMQFTIEETGRRRKIQADFNKEHNIIPETIKSTVKDSLAQHLKATGWQEYAAEGEKSEFASGEQQTTYHTVEDLRAELDDLEKRMRQAAEELAFEEAAEYRDRIKELTEVLLAC